LALIEPSTAVAPDVRRISTVPVLLCEIPISVTKDKLGKPYSLNSTPATALYSIKPPLALKESRPTSISPEEIQQILVVFSLAEATPPHTENQTQREGSFGEKIHSRI